MMRPTEIITDKQRLEARLQSLLQKHGRLHPADVVDDARDPESPLHAHFEWDDARASEEWRREQARRLIRAVPVLVRYERIALRVPKYVRDPDLPKGEAGYVELATIRTKADQAREVVRAEADRATAAVVRAQKVAAALGLEHRLDELLERLQAVREMAS